MDERARAPGQRAAASRDAVAHAAIRILQRRFLESSKDAQSEYGYEFETGGLPKRIVENGVVTDLIMSGNTLVAGSLTSVFDDLGRTVQRGDAVLAYGPDGELAQLTRGARTFTFVHDEEGQRLAKVDNGCRSPRTRRAMATSTRRSSSSR